MYAVIKTGGKQYKVAVGDILKVEKIESEQGASVSLPVTLVVAGAKVTTDVATHLVSVQGADLAKIREIISLAGYTPSESPVHA